MATPRIKAIRKRSGRRRESIILTGQKRRRRPGRGDELCDIAVEQILTENKDLIVKWFNVSSMRNPNQRNAEIADIISKKLVRRLGCNLGFLSQILNWEEGGQRGIFGERILDP